jgi:hypothetical protein
MSVAIDFVIKRSDLHQSRFERAPVSADLQPGQLLLNIDRFALTANNITYAMFGDAMQYWNFFPGPEGWGRIPAFGFADVAASKHEAIAVGERLYGYLPMSTHLVLQPERVGGRSFSDGTPHRRVLPGAYQHYSRVSNDPRHKAVHEDLHALLMPLFITSFLIDDFLAENALFGARAVALSSASSKTALGVAFLLKQHRRCEVIGLTSPRNAAFCARLGCYDRIVGYDDLRSIEADLSTVFVDMAGNGALLHDVHHHFGDKLKYSCMVGGTHWDRRAAQHGLPGAKPTFFFAPGQIKKRTQEWGPAGFEARVAEAWWLFRNFAGSWLRVARGYGEQALQAAYLETLEGRTPPDVGHMLSLRQST